MDAVHEDLWSYVLTLLPTDVEARARTTGAFRRARGRGECRDVAPVGAGLWRGPLVAESGGGVGGRSRGEYVVRSGCVSSSLFPHFHHAKLALVHFC